MHESKIGCSFQSGFVSKVFGGRGDSVRIVIREDWIMREVENTKLRLDNINEAEKH